MYKRKNKKKKQKGRFFMLPFIYQMKTMNKMVGKGIQNPYENNRLMLRKGKQKGGFFGWKEIWS